MQAKKKTKLVGILKKIINGYSSAYIAIEKIINIFALDRVGLDL